MTIFKICKKILFIAFILIFGLVLACDFEPPREVEWKIGELIDFPNGLRLTLNKVWMEKQLDYPFVVISITLENTTDEIQDGINLETPISSNVWIARIIDFQVAVVLMSARVFGAKYIAYLQEIIRSGHQE